MHGKPKKSRVAKVMMSSFSSQYSAPHLKQAIEWFVRLQSEQCSAEEQRRFETWMAKNENHRVAYAEAERVWANMDELKFMPIPELDEARSSKPRKSTAAQLALWTFFMLSTTLLGGAWLEYSAETINYATRMGEHKRVELANNSYIDLNTDTHVSVRMSLLQRNVVLTQGEALFEVGHNRLRPFTVQVGDLRIRDVGTRFNVRKQAKGTTVSVLEGEVELNNGRSVNNERLFAGNQRSYTETTGLGQLETVEADQLTAWVNGQLIFKRTPLGEVTAELERYHPVQFTFADPKLAQETLSGTFNSDDIDPFLHALEAILPIQAKQNGQQIQLRRAQKN
jgi:transmembrane sensor